jgi:para-nitrobenzyl esterase
MEGSTQRPAKAIVERLTRLGRVRGLERMGIETYRGLRYAAPVERFRASTLATAPWKGVHDGTRFGPMAMQPAMIPAIYGTVPEVPYSEDCLVLNIHAPKEPARTPRPGGSANCYDGTALAKCADAVVVCINYRLGVFAALDLDWLGTARDGGGQLWLGDQITALQWVRDNIADYGGDARLVTVIGESAGAVSVAALCAAPSAEGLVHRAVACSTGYMVPEPSRDVVAVIAKMRRSNRAEALAYLQSASAEELIALKRGKQLSPIPVSKTPLLPGRMEDLIRSRGSRAVPLIAGYATHEGLALELMVKAATGWPQPFIRLLSQLAAHGIAMHGAKSRAGAKAYLRRLKKATGSWGFGATFSDVVWTDGFRRGAVEYAEMTTAAGSRGYVYEMNVPMRFAGRSIPASHGVDLALTFNVGDDPEHTVPAFADHPNADALARRWVAMLGHFARHGEPGAALGEWPVYEPQRRASLCVSGEGCVIGDDLQAKFREQVWI